MQNQANELLAAKTLTGLIKACFADYKLQPKQVFDELNVKTAKEITEKPSDCYRMIAAAREYKRSNIWLEH